MAADAKKQEKAAKDKRDAANKILHLLEAPMKDLSDVLGHAIAAMVPDLLLKPARESNDEFASIKQEVQTVVFDSDKDLPGV